MKVIKVAKIARKPNSGKLFTGTVTVQPVIGEELSKNLVMEKVSFGPGVRINFTATLLSRYSSSLKEKA